MSGRNHMLRSDSLFTCTRACCATSPQSYDAAEFDKLGAKYEALNWRMISKPGGATVKPDDFYSLYGCGWSFEYR